MQHLEYFHDFSMFPGILWSVEQLLLHQLERGVIKWLQKWIVFCGVFSVTFHFMYKYRSEWLILLCYYFLFFLQKFFLWWQKDLQIITHCFVALGEDFFFFGILLRKLGWMDHLLRKKFSWCLSINWYTKYCTPFLVEISKCISPILTLISSSLWNTWFWGWPFWVFGFQKGDRVSHIF